jgi:hypothetical protein
VLNCHGHAALAASVELGENDSSKSDRLMELLCLDEGVRTCCCVDDKQAFVGRVGVVLRERSFHFGKLLHEVALRM